MLQRNRNQKYLHPDPYWTKGSMFDLVIVISQDSFHVSKAQTPLKVVMILFHCIIAIFYFS